MNRTTFLCFLCSLLCLLCSVPSSAQDRAFLNQYCVTCHNEKTKIAGLMLDKLDVDHPGENAETGEKGVRKLRAGMMPPSGIRRPERSVMNSFTSSVEAKLDQA